MEEIHCNCVQTKHWPALCSSLAGSELATADISLSLYWPGTLGTSLRFPSDQRILYTFTFAVKLSFTRLRGQRLSCSHVTEQNWIKTWQSHNRDSAVLQLSKYCLANTGVSFRWVFSAHVGSLQGWAWEPLLRETSVVLSPVTGHWWWQEGDGHGD